MPTLIRSWEAMRALEVAKWQQRCRIDWDATDGRNLRAQAYSMGNVDGDGEVLIPSGRRRLGSGGPGPGEGLREGQSSCGVGPDNALQFPKKDIAGALWVFRAPEAGSLKDVCRRLSRPSPPSCQGQSGSCLFVRISCKMH